MARRIVAFFLLFGFNACATTVQNTATVESPSPPVAIAPGTASQAGVRISDAIPQPPDPQRLLGEWNGHLSDDIWDWRWRVTFTSAFGEWVKIDLISITDGAEVGSMFKGERFGKVVGNKVQWGNVELHWDGNDSLVGTCICRNRPAVLNLQRMR